MVIREELNGKIICALKVPSDANEFKMFNDVDRPYLSYKVGVDVRREYVPNGKYQFLNLSKDMTEEVAKTIMPSQEFELWALSERLYFNFINQTYSFNSALESFRTWEKSVGIVTVNPYGNEKPAINDRDVANPNYGKRAELQLQWIKAQRLVKNIAYLVKEG